MTTSTTTVPPGTSLADFIAERLEEIRARKSPMEVARDAGFDSESTLQLIASRKAKLPLDFVLPLARALDTDGRSFAATALRQFVADEFVEVLLDDTRREAERAILVATTTAMAVELVNLKGDIRSVANGSDAHIAMIKTLDRLIEECGKLATSTQ